ncbi:unnamed protein product [Clonostachys rhizophaga]|uniref:Uncharacterized protein n=1 Tax=Clonostachys rhizophaga TaxID=160324 RepID=A0A9N9VVL3_9HYPO|nr:unnamed protein product [Clonostachys rhizophaga]
MQKQNAHEYAQAFKASGQPPWFHGLFLHWRKLFEEPYKGIINDCNYHPALRSSRFEAHTAEASSAMAIREPKKATCYHIDSPEWRSWPNPEFFLSDKGIRLDEITAELEEDVFGVLKADLSAEGYEKAIGAMIINQLLGELVESSAIMNESSYNFVLFGEPSTARPTLQGGPNLEQELLGLRLMQDLPKDQQARAQVYKLLNDPAMPHGQWNHDDQRHLCGACRDNRMVPYEGILVSEMTGAQQDEVWGLQTSSSFIYQREPANSG